MTTQAEARVGGGRGLQVHSISQTGHEQTRAAMGPFELSAYSFYPVDWLDEHLGRQIAATLLRRCRIVSGMVWGEAVIHAARELFGVLKDIPLPNTEGENSAELSELLTPTDAAKLLRISVRSLMRLEEAGGLVAKDLSPKKGKKRLIRFRRIDVDSLLSNGGYFRLENPVVRPRMKVLK